MIRKFDFLSSDGGNLVLSEDLNILISTLLTILSVIVLNDEDIDQVFTLKISTIYCETQ